MKSNLLFLLPLFILIGCTSDTTKPVVTTAANNSATETTKPAIALRDTFDCELYGKPDKKTALWMADKELYIRMSTDEFTDDMKNAVDFNVLQIYDTKSCELIYNGKLPLAKGTNTPYKLQTDLYEPINQIICTQGLDYAFCYHIGSRNHLLPLNAQIPPLKLNKISSDAARDLEVYSRYLFGWTAGLGTYGYNLSDIRNVGNEQPIASYPAGAEINNLYLLNVHGGSQLVIPSVQSEKVVVTELLKKPQPLSRRVVRAGSSGRYAILRPNAGNVPIIVDVQEKKLVKLPKRVETNTLAVKEYLHDLK